SSESTTNSTDSELIPQICNVVYRMLTFKLLYFVKRNAVKKNGNAPIIARITIDQVVAQFNTKLEINPAHWSVKLGKASGRTAEAVHINSMLESIHSTVPQQD
ncbi:Arm DNA-binding domain-containing protein, partial [Bacteroides uniformis]